MSRLQRLTHAVSAPLTAQLIRVGHHSTRLVGRHLGERFPFYYVTEYQKSGGTWLGQMIAESLQLAFPQHPRLPVLRPAVLHNHWAYDPRLRRVFYLYRDGRDVMVSLWFHRMREIQAATAAGQPHSHTAVYERLFGRGYDPADTRRHLARFIEHELAHPRGTRVAWPEHVASWAFDRPHVVTLSYEALLADAAAELTRCLPLHTGQPVDPARVAAAVEHHRFARQTGRTAGQEDRSSFRRKGVAGDWINHFNREAGQRFEASGGEVLRRLGYTAPPGWADTLPE